MIKLRYAKTAVLMILLLGLGFIVFFGLLESVFAVSWAFQDGADVETWLRNTLVIALTLVAAAIAAALLNRVPASQSISKK